MAISVFDLFKIGIGPSSSHTVGPMHAALLFLRQLESKQLFNKVTGIDCELYGSLAATGKGHGTDKAVLLGLEGELPETVDTDSVDGRIETIRDTRRLKLLGKKTIRFDPESNILFARKKSLPEHPNGMTFHAWENDKRLLKQSYFSVGGGFILSKDAFSRSTIVPDVTTLPYPFTTATELLALCKETGLSISQLMLENEKHWKTETDIRQQLVEIWHVMQQCVDKGCRTEGVLPGGLKVERRAARLFRQLSNETTLNDTPLGTMDWVDLFALAVNEENAAGGRVVTAPTNGAAGIIPAVLHYYWKFCSGFSEEGIIRFMLTAGAIGILYKENASISGAEVGCQGEVGAACSMAAGALTEVLGGTPAQVENAAEIAMEHNLGLTCDPIGGLVQVPCIERNAMGAVKAINASRMALRGDGNHFVSLDRVIKTMKATGADMKTKYKETARGGLAVNVIEC